MLQRGSPLWYHDHGQRFTAVINKVLATVPETVNLFFDMDGVVLYREGVLIGTTGSHYAEIPAGDDQPDVDELIEHRRYSLREEDDEVGDDDDDE